MVRKIVENEILVLRVKPFVAKCLFSIRHRFINLRMKDTKMVFQRMNQLTRVIVHSKYFQRFGCWFSKRLLENFQDNI